MNRLLCLAFALCVIGATAPHARAQDAATGGSEWEYLIEPYFLAPHMDGTSGFGTETRTVDVGPDEVFDHLRIGAMLYLEARSAKWAVSFDGLYMNLGEEDAGPMGNFTVGVRQTGISYAAYRRIAPWAELTAGVTLNKLRGALQGSGPLQLDVGGHESWVDPTVGVRLGNSGGGKWRWTILGTVGGFGVGSDFAWQAYPQLGFRATELLELTAAYRAISMDFEDGEGEDRFLYDVTTFGPQLGIRIHL